LLNEQGDVLTNDHVLKSLEGAKAIRVKLGDGSVREARIMVSKPELDLAILSIGPTTPHAYLGNPLVLQEGKRLRVIGFPAAGELGCDVPATTQGQLTRRDVKPPEGFTLSMASGVEVPACPAEGVLELQADPEIGGALAIPGSSGSPVINEKGQVVGILCGGREVEVRGIKVIAAYVVPVDLTLKEFEELGPRVPPHAPEFGVRTDEEIVKVSGPAEVEEGQEIALQVGFWDANGDLEAVELRAISPSKRRISGWSPIPRSPPRIRPSRSGRVGRSS
ncbi:MAG TPA: serine protease, partial [Candidatus Latescibacteria bacterium]|nr:serine protease [Candidatus Latescibacterota bacterium]